MKLKRFVFVLAILLIVGGSSVAFAWWDSLDVTEEEITIGVGEGVTLNVSSSNDFNDVLVPAGVVSQEGQVQFYELTYTVNLDREIDETLNLSVSALKKAIDGDTELGDNYVNVLITHDSTIQNDDVIVTVIITLDMDENDAADVANVVLKDITFDLEFIATQQE